MSSADCELDGLKKLAEKRRKAKLDARVIECVIVALLVWFFCGLSAFGVGLLVTGFVKAVGASIITSVLGCFAGFTIWAIHVYRQVTEEVNAEFEKHFAAAKQSWPQFFVPEWGRDNRYIRRDSSDESFLVTSQGEVPFAWHSYQSRLAAIGEYKPVTEAEAKTALK